MKHSISSFRAGFGELAYIMILWATCAHAGVTTVAWYRMGENDPGAASGQVVYTRAVDLVGADHLWRIGSPVYGQVSSSATPAVGSSLAVGFNGVNQYYSNVVVTAARDNFGIEAWVAFSTGSLGSYLIAHNGTSGNGWGLSANVTSSGGMTYHGEFGGVATISTASIKASKWVHLALVRDGGTSTLYLNGVGVRRHDDRHARRPDGQFSCRPSLGSVAHLLTQSGLTRCGCLRSLPASSARMICC